MYAEDFADAERQPIAFSVANQEMRPELSFFVPVRFGTRLEAEQSPERDTEQQFSANIHQTAQYSAAAMRQRMDRALFRDFLKNIRLPGPAIPTPMRKITMDFVPRSIRLLAGRRPVRSVPEANPPVLRDRTTRLRCLVFQSRCLRVCARSSIRRTRSRKRPADGGVSLFLGQEREVQSTPPRVQDPGTAVFDNIRQLVRRSPSASRTRPRRYQVSGDEVCWRRYRSHSIRQPSCSRPESARRRAVSRPVGAVERAETAVLPAGAAFAGYERWLRFAGPSGRQSTA